MTDVTTTSTCRRVAALESWAFRADADLADLRETLGDPHLVVQEEIVTCTSLTLEEIVDGMSALTAEVRSLGSRMDAVEKRVGSMDDKLDLILAKLG
ncbi:hypothetical protein [Streptosporangium saharense]|uniref:hypothetical protein n=1 Tax=Streptosporangium saharense TaxID=1706840 RepID=UPI00331CC973